jgi:hypothetical protein
MDPPKRASQARETIRRLPSVPTPEWTIVRDACRRAVLAWCDARGARYVPPQPECLQHARERHGQEAGAEELDAATTVHLSSQHFESVDMPFDRTVAPRFADGAFDRAQILPEFPHEPLEGRDLRGLGACQPAAQGWDLPHPQNGAKTQDQPPHRRKPWTPLFQRVHRVRLTRAEQRPRLTEQRGGDLRRHVSGEHTRDRGTTGTADVASGRQGARSLAKPAYEPT